MPGVLGNPASAAGAAPPRHARPFVALFLAALVVCPLAVVNLWPFSSWELFSRLRTDRQTTWEAVAVDRAGRERTMIRSARSPTATAGFVFIMRGFSTRAAAARDAVCATWLRGANAGLGRGRSCCGSTGSSGGSPIAAAAAPRRPAGRLAWVCSAKGAREVG